MNALLWCGGIGVDVPGKERAEREVLYYRELGEDFGVEHFDHTLVIVNYSLSMEEEDDIKQDLPC